MTTEQLKRVLELHDKWVKGEEVGVRADLSEANLSGANLRWAKNITSFGPMPTSGRMVYAVRYDIGWMVQSGCFWVDLDKLESRVKSSHNCPVYLGVIELLRKYNP